MRTALAFLAFHLRLMFSRRWFLTTLLVLLGAAVCARLGIWQLDRLEQRRAFNAHVLEMWSLPPVDLNANPDDDLAAMEYRSAVATGVYDFENQIAIRNQTWTGADNVPQPGYRLLTPLLLADGGPAVLVDRGWIPSEGNGQPDDWRKYDTAGEATVTGILRAGRSQPDLGGVPDPELAPGQTRLDFWNLVNIARIDSQTPYDLLPAYLQADPDPGRAQPPYPSQPEIEISEGPHAGYAGQWFTFAAILLIGYPFYLRKQTAETGK